MPQRVSNAALHRVTNTTALSAKKEVEPKGRRGTRAACASARGRLRRYLSSWRQEQSIRVKTLWKIVISSLLAVLQLVAGVAAHSLSLIGDGVIMIVDVISYCVAIAAESAKSCAQERARRQARIPGQLPAAGRGHDLPVFRRDRQAD